MKALALPFLLLSHLTLTSAQVYLSISAMEELLDTQLKIIDDLNLYVESEEKRIEHLKRTMKTFTKENEEARSDVENYLGNPVNAFTLIKRLTTDLDKIEKSSIQGMAYINAVRSRPEANNTTQDDLKGAAEALVRVKDLYKLDIADLVAGNIEGFSTPMKTTDCYELALILYNNNDRKNALNLFMVALNKYDEAEDGHELTKAEILEYIAYTHYVLGDTETALEWTKKLLQVDPANPRGLTNVESFHREVNEANANNAESNKMENYQALCRGDVTVPDVVTKKLRCRFMTENHPFLRLAAIKQEQVYIKPDIYLFHDVLSDDEIREIQELSKPMFAPSTTASLVENATRTVSTYRISKTAFLKDDSETVARVSRRVRDLTGMDLATAEEMQVVNYGVGGHYHRHVDAAVDEDRHSAFPLQGNRIATVLFYLSDVPLGGATVFPELGLRVAPQKRSAVFWLNLHPSGEPDLAVSHGSCAVGRGSKWIATKWLHQVGQEFIRPCSLAYEPQGIQWDIAPPVLKNKR